MSITTFILSHGKERSLQRMTVHTRKLFAVCCLFFSFTVFSQAQTKLLKEGADLFRKEDYPAALKVFKKEARKNNSCETQFWIASCHFKMEELAIAKEQFLRIINDPCLGPELAMSLVNLGSCYRGLKQIDSAFYYYDKTIVNFPKYAGAYFNKAQLVRSLDRFQEAEGLYTKAIALDPKDPVLFMKRQEIYFILQQYDQALQDMLKAKALKPDLEIAFNMAYCYSMLERYQEADSLFQTIYDETDAVFLNNYGFNKHKLGQSSLGIELIEKSIRLSPKNSYAYRNLAIIAIDNKDLPKTCEHLRKAKALNFSGEYGTEVDELILLHCTGR